jgi:hypothetical protein
MRQPIRPKQRDLFATPVTAPLSLPREKRVEVVSLLRALLLEVISQQRSQPQQEPPREQQNNT